MADETPSTTESTTTEAPPKVSDDEVKQYRLERDRAVGENAKIRKELDDLKAKLPSDDQLKHWQELETHAAEAEEARKKKAGEWDALRQQLVDKHEKSTKELAERAEAAERKLNDTLVGLAFAGATDWFGPSGKTVLLPEIAQTYFAKSVAVEVNGDGLPNVVVKDAHGNTMLDPANGQPMEFGKAIGELINAHPQKDHLLRGSGKVGSGSAGGTGHLTHETDVDTLIAQAREGNKDALAALQARQRKQGGMVMGPAFQKPS